MQRDKTSIVQHLIALCKENKYREVKKHLASYPDDIYLSASVPTIVFDINNGAHIDHINMSLLSYCLHYADIRAFSMIRSTIDHKRMVEFFHSVCEAARIINSKHTFIDILQKYNPMVDVMENFEDAEKTAQLMLCLPHHALEAMCGFPLWNGLDISISKGANFHPESHTFHVQPFKQGNPLELRELVSIMLATKDQIKFLWRGKQGACSFVTVHDLASLPFIKSCAKIDSRLISILLTANIKRIFTQMQDVATHVQQRHGVEDAVAQLTSILAGSNPFLASCKQRIEEGSRLSCIADIAPGKAVTRDTLCGFKESDVIAVLCKTAPPMRELPKPGLIEEYLDSMRESASIEEQLRAKDIPEHYFPFIASEFMDPRTKKFMRIPVKIFDNVYCYETIIANFKNPRTKGVYIEPSSQKEFQLNMLQPFSKEVIDKKIKVVIMLFHELKPLCEDKPAVHDKAKKLKNLFRGLDTFNFVSLANCTFNDLPAFSTFISLIEKHGLALDDEMQHEIEDIVTFEPMAYPIKAGGAQTIDIGSALIRDGSIPGYFYHELARKECPLTDIVCDLALYLKYAEKLKEIIVDSITHKELITAEAVVAVEPSRSLARGNRERPVPPPRRRQDNPQGEEGRLFNANKNNSRAAPSFRPNNNNLL